MKLHNQQVGNTNLRYFIHGKNPCILFDSGIHGDEYEVINCLKNSLSGKLNQLLDFLYIPEMSPSAVELKTRVNAYGLDLNRSFVSGIDSDEVTAIKNIVSNYTFDLGISFHEDPIEQRFYIYDTDLLDKEKLLNLQLKIKNIGVDLFTGIDDSQDPVLGYEFVGGYKKNHTSTVLKNDGTFLNWVIDQSILKRAFMPEIPGKISLDKKQKLVDLLIDELIELI